ncbi:MAG: four helix bundle protein [Chloroflexota bacterium]
MALVKRFEELICWQKARELTNLVYDYTELDAFSKDYGLRNQIRRAAGSSMHNIAEGFDAGSRNEFARFLRMARRSASEVQSQLYLAMDRAYITSKQREVAHNLADEVKPMINSLHKRLTDTKA